MNVKRITWSVLLWLAVLSTALASIGCVVGGGRTNVQGAPRVFETADWQTIAEPDVNLRFDMPARPSRETEVSRLSDGRRVNRSFGSTRSRGVVFGYVAIAFEQGITGSLLGELDGLVESNIETLTDAEVVSASELWLSGYPGTEVRLENTAQTQKLIVRHYIGRSRAYIFFVGLPTSSDAVAEAAAQRFFGSIVFDPADAPSVMGTGQVDLGTASWRWITPPEAGFAVELPGVPRRTEREVTIEGHTYDEYVYTMADDMPEVAIELSTVQLTARESDSALDVLQARLVGANGVIEQVRQGARIGYPFRQVRLTRDGRRIEAILVRTTYRAHVLSIDYPQSLESEVAPVRDRMFSTFILP